MFNKRISALLKNCRSDLNFVNISLLRQFCNPFECKILNNHLLFSFCLVAYQVFWFIIKSFQSNYNSYSIDFIPDFLGCFLKLIRAFQILEKACQIKKKMLVLLALELVYLQPNQACLAGMWHHVGC